MIVTKVILVTSLGHVIFFTEGFSIPVIVNDVQSWVLTALPTPVPGAILHKVADDVALVHNDSACLGKHTRLLFINLGGISKLPLFAFCWKQRGGRKIIHASWRGSCRN